MGKILKAEFQYNMTGILIGYSIVILAFLAGLNGGMDNIYGLITVSFITFFISIGIMGGESDKEKRDRFLTSLPIPLKQYSIARLLFVIFYKLGMFLILSVFYLLKVTPENSSTFWIIITMNSYALIFISFFILYSDFKYYNSKYVKYYYLIGLFIIAMLFIAGILFEIFPKPVIMLGNNSTNTFFDAAIVNIIMFGNNSTSTFFYAAIVNIICWGMIYIDFLVYNKRNSYLG
jgi:hypothetical protein